MLTLLMGSGTAGRKLTCSGNDLLSELLNLEFASTKAHQVTINYGEFIRTGLLIWYSLSGD